MTEVIITENEDEIVYPIFKTLKEGQYFQELNADYGNLSIKIPEVITEAGCKYNSYNLKTNCLEYKDPNIICCYIDRCKIIF